MSLLQQTHCRCLGGSTRLPTLARLPQLFSLPRTNGALPTTSTQAEHFLSAGDSPPKLPSLPLLTPRAFLGRAASPTAAGPIANLRDSTGSLKGWLCEDSSLKSDWRLVDQQGGANGGLRPCTTAKGGAAVDAVGRTSSPPTSGAGTGTAPGTATGAAAATSRTATNASQQRWSRPLLPRLDVKAAAAAAAAEAAEQEEEEEAAAAEAAAAAAAANSPLSSPGSSTEVSPMAPYSGSSCVTSSCSASSPDCHRLTPNTLRTAAQGNPLWGASPGSRAPSPAAAAAAGTQIVLRQPRFDEAGDTGAASNSMVSPPPPQTRQLLRWEDEEEGGADADEGYGGGLLDSILSPPHLKPAHSQLLGALMHTSGDSASRAAAAAAAAAQARQRARQLELGWRVVSDELEASPVDGAAADGGAVLRLEHPEQEEEEEEEARVAQPAAAVVELAGEAAEQPGVETLCSVEAAPAGEGTEPSSNSSSSGLRRAALLLLGAVAGAAMAVAAGAVQQGKPMRRSFCRPQPVPSLAGRRLLPSEQQRALREARPGPGGGAAAALPGDRMDTITRG